MNLRKAYQTGLQKIENMKWWKRIMLFEAIIFGIVIIPGQFHGACTSYGLVGEIPEASFRCTSYTSFFEFYGLGYFPFVLELAILLGIFLAITAALGKRTEKIFSKHSLFGKAFMIELWFGVLAAFGLMLLLLGNFEGYSCMANDCVKISVLGYTGLWFPLLGVFLFFNPFSLLIIIAPFFFILIHKLIGWLEKHAN